MATILIVYYSRTGNTRRMAELVADGVKEAGSEAILADVQETEPAAMRDADGVILGSPTYYGHSSGQMRLFLDKSVKFHGKLEGKVGGAFSSAANVGGGNETTVLDLLHALLIHGMIVPGTAWGDHYGPVSVGAPDERAGKLCRRLGRRVAELADTLRRAAPETPEA